MLNPFITFILIALFIFTPIAFGSMEIWAFSLMELGILLIIILWALQKLVFGPHSSFRNPHSEFRNQESALRVPNSAFLLLSLFLLLVLFQMLPLPSGIIKIISPKTFFLRQALSLEPSALSYIRFRV